MNAKANDKNLTPKSSHEEEKVDATPKETKTESSGQIISHPNSKPQLPFLHQSTETSELLRRCRLIAKQVEPVIIVGETGTGKTLLAEYMHKNSDRSTGPFITIGAGTISDELFSSTLFGHVKGAFTGAVQDKKGLLEEADGGTLVLNDIDALGMESQKKLLTYFDTNTASRVGEPHICKTYDVRIVATCNQDLFWLVTQNRFREDLMYRLRQWRLEIKPLRDRREDIPVLIEKYLQEFFEKNKTSPDEAPWQFAPALIEALKARPWKGNVRDLKAVVQCIALFANGDKRPISCLAGMRVLEDPNNGFVAPKPKTSSHADCTAEEVKRLLRETDGNVTLTAKILGMSRTTLYKLMKTNNIDPTH